MTDRKTSSLRVNASTLARLLLPTEPPTRHMERAPTVKVASIEGPPTEVEKGGTTLILDIEHDGGLPAGVFSLADLPFSMRRSFEWKYPELPDVSTIAIAQELIDELDPVLQHAVIRYLASRFGVTL